MSELLFNEFFSCFNTSNNNNRNKEMHLYQQNYTIANEFPQNDFNYISIICGKYFLFVDC